MSKHIGLTQGYVALVDASDWEWLSRYSWCAMVVTSGHVYARGSYPSSVGEDGKRRQRARLMHRFIMGEPKGMHVDHINGDTLDNRRSNLRVATASQNQANRKPNRLGSTPYKGVHLHRPSGKYKMKFTALFDTAEEAAEAYRLASGAVHGDFAYKG